MSLLPLPPPPVPYNEKLYRQQIIRLYQEATAEEIANQEDCLAQIQRLARDHIVAWNFPTQSRFPRWDVRTEVNGIQLFGPSRNDNAPRGYEGFREIYSLYSAAAFHDSVMSPVSREHRETGTIYIYTRPGDPQYINIGMTKNLSIEELTTKIETTCGYTPTFHVTLFNVPLAGRILQLIHRELEHLTLRRIEPVCKHGGLNTNGVHDRLDRTLCHGAHKNWFEMPVTGYGGAKDLVQTWIWFIDTCKPYNDDGTIKDVWAKKINLLTFRRRVLTINVLLAMESELRVPGSVSLDLAERQSWWTGLTVEAMWVYREYGRLKKIDRVLTNCMDAITADRPPPLQSVLADHSPIIDEEDLTCIDEDEVYGDFCVTIFKNVGPCERVCPGCINPSHKNRYCAWRVVVEWIPLSDEWRRE